jgi:3',5'-cyclic AMP phosphodiesterase CpdA
MFVLAHLSDPHLGPLPKARMVDLASKRVLGYINWQRTRRAVHRADVLEAVTQDVKLQAPDHIAVTGDVVNIALAAEFTQARGWLAGLGAPCDVTLVPGNHDAYVRSALRHHGLHWGDYMREDDDALVAGEIAFPFVRRRGPVALIGLSSAIPTAPFMATGRLGAAQIKRLAAILASLASERLFRVVLIHHPPLSAPAHRFKWLADARDLRALLAQAGAELVIHGHDHVHSLVWLEGPAGARIPALGVPSASAAPSRGRHTRRQHAAYNLYRIEGTAGAWSCEAISRGYRAGTERVVELERRKLA